MDPREYGRQWRAKNREKQANYKRAWYQENKKRLAARRQTRRAADSISFLVTEAKSRAKKEGRPFDLEPGDLTLPEFCPVFPWIRLKVSLGNGFATRPESPSLDRIDSSRGYIKGNVWIISWRANTVKNCGTAVEHELIAAAMRAHGVE